MSRSKGNIIKRKIYQPVCLENDVDDALREQLTLHHKAINYYYEEQWEKAQQIFKTLKGNNKKDKY